MPVKRVLSSQLSGTAALNVYPACITPPLAGYLCICATGTWWLAPKKHKAH
jgi:hypothetical protein